MDFQKGKKMLEVSLALALAMGLNLGLVAERNKSNPDEYPVVLLHGPITQSSGDYTAGLMASALLLSRDKIILSIDSGGGVLSGGYKITRILGQFGDRIICRVDGKASSLAFFIFSHCKNKVVTSKSSFMWHAISIRMPLTPNEQTEYNDEQELFVHEEIKITHRTDPERYKDYQEYRKIIHYMQELKKEQLNYDAILVVNLKIKNLEKFLQYRDKGHHMTWEELKALQK